MNSHILQFDGPSLELLAHAQDACGQIPPAFPLEATVAVNPYLGQSRRPLPETAALMARVGGGAVTQPRAALMAKVKAGAITQADLMGALEAEVAPLHTVDDLMEAAEQPSLTSQALPTVAEVLRDETGKNWPDIVAERLSLWAGGHFDKGQAFWPAPEQDVWVSWRAFASRDLSLEIQGLAGFTAFVSELPSDRTLAFVDLCQRLEIAPTAAPTLFHRVLMSHSGWSQYARGLDWRAGLEGADSEAALGLLTIALAFEAALLAQATPAQVEVWHTVMSAHAMPVVPTLNQRVDVVLQEAAERAEQRRLEGLLNQHSRQQAPRPDLQAVFCIDVRSEIFRRAFEAQHAGIETYGFAGFFGMPIAHADATSDVDEARVPALLAPSLASTTGQDASESRILARATRAWGRFRQAAVSSFAFVEAMGLVYGAKLVAASLPMKKAGKQDPTPLLGQEVCLGTKVGLAKGALGGIGLGSYFAKTVLLVGHRSEVRNAPHASALACGACGGHGGAVNARVLAGLLNDPLVRADLAKDGVAIPSKTVFLAAEHVTSTDEVVLFAEDLPQAMPASELTQLRGWLDAARAETNAERAQKLPKAHSAKSVEARALDWAQTRPEWGLAGCSSFIAAPRDAFKGVNLEGKTFLHEFQYAQAGNGGLEALLTAPVVVASWIGLQYYGSVTAPEVFGGGSKVIHNVVGGFGVLEGASGPLRAGLPWQSVHNGTDFQHEALRLSILIAAPEEAIGAVLSQHPDVQSLFDSTWLHLFTLDDDGRIKSRYRPGGTWERQGTERVDVAIAAE